MKNNYRIIAIILCLIVIFGGCAKIPYTNNNEKTKLITDCVGRQVEIPESPDRVACLYAATAHIIALVDEGDKIVGAPNGVKRDVIMQTKYPKIKNISVPFQSGLINVEELLKINADIALVRKSTAGNPSEVEKLEKLNIPYVVVDFSTIAELKKAIKVVGEIFDKEEITNDYIQYMDNTINYVGTRIKDLNDNEKVSVYHSANEATKTYSTDSLSAEIATLAGVKNVSLNMKLTVGEDGGYTSLEEIYKLDPQVIIANDFNVPKYILSNEKWKGLTAVKNKKVISLPVGVSRWGHFGSIEPHMGVLFIASTIYPEKFNDLDMTKMVIDYYTKFFKLNMSEELAQQILTGEGMRLEK